MRHLIFALVAVATLTQSDCLLLRTPATAEYLKLYRAKLPKDFSVVEYGGWFRLEQEATAELGRKNLEQLKPYLPRDLDFVECGGMDMLEMLAPDPKGALLQMSSDLSVRGETSLDSPQHLPAILALLHAQGKGFDSHVVDGDWVMVMQKQGSKSPKVQKLVGRGERPGKSYSTFDVQHGRLNGDVRLLKGLGRVTSKVKYVPVSDNFSTIGKKIVLRRIRCDIVGAGFKVWKLPRLPLPFLRRKGGHLDFVYLDRDIRVTKGNRGGLFVHARPAVAAQVGKGDFA